MIMKQQIYQNGFYLLLGLIFGTLTTLIALPEDTPKPLENTIRIEMVQDSVKITSKDKNVKIAQIKPKVLNETNLKKELTKNNIPHANIVLAQAKLESGNFKSDLVRTHQNIFGLKKGNRYRRYSHWTECVEDYKKCISDRYDGGNYYTFLNRIGYASHPNYTELLKDMV
jgi:flagellum-specific peptidoglycan hydrolase FlgJ